MIQARDLIDIPQRNASIGLLLLVKPDLLNVRIILFPRRIIIWIEGKRVIHGTLKLTIRIKMPIPIGHSTKFIDQTVNNRISRP